MVFPNWKWSKWRDFPGAKWWMMILLLLSRDALDYVSHSENARWKGINFMTIWETEFPFLIIKWCPIIIFSEVPWWLKLSYLTQGHKEIPEGPKAKLEAYDLHSRMYHTMKTQAPFTTGTQSRLPPWPSTSLPVLVRMDFCETAVCLEFEGECRDPKI